MSEFSEKLREQLHPEGVSLAQIAGYLGAIRSNKSQVWCANPPFWALEKLAGWMEIREMDAVGTVSLALAEKTYIPLGLLKNEENHKKLARYAMELWQDEFYCRNGREAK